MEAYREYWDTHATHAGAVKAVTHWGEAKYAEFYRDILADLEELPVKVVADVGCGPALMYPLIQELWPGAEYHGYDVSTVMLYDATFNVPSGIFHTIIEHLDIRIEPDLILCHSVFTHITPDDTLSYLKMFRVALATNGVISASIHTNAKVGAVGTIGRMDYDPAYFEELVKLAGLRVASFVDVAVPAGIARYYRLVL